MIFQIDFGQVRGADNIEGFRKQTDDLLVGYGIGFGFNTDLPYMEDTDLRFLFASPKDDPSNLKIYAGFGGWLQ